jgi:hypothetical protein
MAGPSRHGGRTVYPDNARINSTDVDSSSRRKETRSLPGMAAATAFLIAAAGRAVSQARPGPVPSP